MINCIKDYWEVQQDQHNNCDIQYELYVSEGWYNSFLSFGLISFGAWPNILLKSKLLKWWMSHGDMTDDGHATILGDYIYFYIP